MLTLTLLSLLACRPDETAETTTEPPTIPTSTATTWGVTEDYATSEGCEAALGDGLNDLYDGEQAVLVHGEGPRDASIVGDILRFYDPRFDQPLLVRAASELSEVDKQHHLMIVGGSDHNSVLTELNGLLPVWFDDGAFTFAGYRWSEPGHGVALIHPSPWADDRYVVLYAGNTLDGAWSTFTVPTGDDDFVALRGRATLQLEGDLCREGARWSVPVDEMLDLRRGWERHVDDLVSVAGTTHEVYAPAGSIAEPDLDTILADVEAQHAEILALLELDPLPGPIRWFLYDTEGDKRDVTEIEGASHANDMNREVHAVYSDTVQATGPYDDTRVVAWHHLGDADVAVLSEGLPVLAAGTFSGIELDVWAAAALSAGTLPSLRDMIDDFYGAGGGSEGDGVGAAGALCRWILEVHGAAALHALYPAEDLDLAFEDVLGMTTAEVEAAWHQTLE